MRFRTPLDDIIGNCVRLKVLRVMFAAADEPLTGRAVAARCGASPSQTNAALAELERSGLVWYKVLGASYVWRLSSRHVMRKPLARLFEQEGLARDRLRRELEAAVVGLPITRAMLFGSVARGDERPNSDVDLFVEVRSVREKFLVQDALSARCLGLSRRFGNVLSSLVLTTDEVRTKSNPYLVSAIEREGTPIALGRAEPHAVAKGSARGLRSQ